MELLAEDPARLSASDSAVPVPTAFRPLLVGNALHVGSKSCLYEFTELNFLSVGSQLPPRTLNILIESAVCRQSQKSEGTKLWQNFMSRQGHCTTVHMQQVALKTEVC